jgi:LPS-assembly protein
VLENRAYLERFPDRDLIALNAYYFQGLRESDNQDRIPIVLPLAESRLVSDRLRWGSHWTLESSAVALTRIEGLDTKRVTTRGAWELPLVGRMGMLYRIEPSLRGDIYATEGNPMTFSAEGSDGMEARLIPQLTTDWSWPFLGDGLGWTAELGPLASLALSTTDVNSSDIPNEDSRDFEFDETNLFEAVRFPGLDRVEGGGRLAYGAGFSAYGPYALQVSGVVGQSLRLYGSSPFPEGSGLEDTFSDYVGRLDVRPTSWVDLGFRFRLAKDEAELRRSDLSLSLGPSWLRFNLDYLNLSREPDSTVDQGFQSREELVLGTRAQLTPQLAVAAQTRRDLSSDEDVANQLGLLYTHPCLTFLAGFERSFTTRGEIEDETTVIFRVALKSLGELQTGNFLGL